MMVLDWLNINLLLVICAFFYFTPHKFFYFTIVDKAFNPHQSGCKSHRREELTDI